MAQTRRSGKAAARAGMTGRPATFWLHPQEVASLEAFRKKGGSGGDWLHALFSGYRRWRETERECERLRAENAALRVGHKRHTGTPSGLPRRV